MTSWLVMPDRNNIMTDYKLS